MGALRRHTGFAVAGSILVACALVYASPATANVQSQALYARGLVPFDRGQWEPAYRLFDQAVAADGTDALALYYRGLTQARRGQRAAAIQDMQQALQLDPRLTHAVLDLGIAYFDDGQYAPARTWLERAYQHGVERFTAALFLGLTCYRLGDDAAAQKYLAEAEADPDLRPTARYYGGLALLRQGKTEAGRAVLQQVAREAPQSEIGRAAQAGVSDQGAAALGAQAGRRKPWSLYGTVGFQYDSNAVLAPADAGVKVAQGITKQADGRAVIGLGGDYQLLESDAVSLLAAYDFYQSVHFNLTEFDLQGHRVRLDATSTRGQWSYGASGIYDFYALDYQSFFQEGLGIPWVVLNESDAAATQAYYALRGRDFFREPYSPARDGINNAVGLRQYFDLGTLGAFGPAAWLLNIGYQFDAEDTLSNTLAARDFQYLGNQWDAGLTFPVYTLAQAQIGYMFRLEDYQYPNSRAAFGFRRHDNEHQVAVVLERDIIEHVSAELDYFGVFNNSNIADFQYDRDIFSASVRVTF